MYGIWEVQEEISEKNDWKRTNFYNNERGMTVYEGRPTGWTGAIGLMYASDYGYSTSTTDTECEDTMWNWNEGASGVICRNNSWLYKPFNQWTLSPSNTTESQVFSVVKTGYVGYQTASTNYDVRPALYLKPDVKIKVGNGTAEQPFELGM